MGNIASATSAACIVAAAVIISKPVCDFVKHRLEAVEADVKKAIELIGETNESLDKIKTLIDGNNSDKSDAVLQAIENIVDGVTKTNEAVDALPGTIDATAKKYSMYLHDEHVNMFELMSRCPSPAISPRSYASEGANYTALNSFKSFNPAAGLGKGPATGLGKGPAAGLGKGPAAGLNPSRKSKNGPLPQASLKGKENF